MAKILVVDDDPNSRLLAATLLESAGHAVAQAANAEQALAHVRSDRVDLVLTDLSLPNASGASLVRTLRADSTYARTAIALYTGSHHNAALDDFIAAYRVAGLLQKPIDPYTFARAIESALETSSAET